MRYLRLTSLCLLLASCDSSGPEEPGVSLTPKSEAFLTNGAMKVTGAGTAYRPGIVAMLPWGDDPRRGVGGAGGPGIWMATAQDGAQSNLASAGLRIGAFNAFRLVSSGTAGAGYYTLTRDSLSGPIENWPTELGAPSDSDGQPKLYGDRMLWSVMLTENESSPANSMIPGIQVGRSIFMFDTAPLEKAVFLRYDIKNTSTTTISDLHLGFGSDLDLAPWDNSDDNWCYRLRVDHNSSGYDLERHLSYVYTLPLQDRNLSDECYGFVTGFAILDMHSPKGLSQPKLAHRIVREGLPNDYGAFSETLLESDASRLLALQGYAADGSAMTDPTGLETKFAFAGDPLTGSGWLDVRHDIRALQSIAPFDLAAGETRSMMVVIIGVSGSDLEEGLSMIRGAYDSVVKARALWDY